MLLTQIIPAFWFVQKQGLEEGNKVHLGNRNEQAQRG